LVPLLIEMATGLSAFFPTTVALPVSFRAELAFARGAGRSWSFWKREKSNHVFVPRRL